MTDEITAIDVSHDEFMTFADARNREDAERASSAGESRQKIGEFLKRTELNGQAASWMRSIMKKKKPSQQMDVILSLEHLLPMVKNHVTGQQGDMFSGSMEPAEIPDADADVDVDRTDAEFDETLAQAAE